MKTPLRQTATKHRGPLRRLEWCAAWALLSGTAVAAWAQTASAPAPLATPPDLAVHDNDVVLFLGDELIDTPEPRVSTNFPYLVETFLTVRYPQLNARYVYSGWNGDTVGRVLLRLDRDVLVHKPTVVVVCLGLNDPQYAPFSEERLAQFKQDMGTLVERLKQAGARVWLISPPSVRESQGINTRVQREGQLSIVNLQAIQYNATLARYAAVLGETAAATSSGFVNWHAASLNLRPETGPVRPWREARLPSPQTHALAATALLRDWRATPIEVTIDYTWKPSTATVSVPGSAPVLVPVETTEAGRRTLALRELPLPWPIPGAQSSLRSGWEAADLCQVVLRVPDPPARDITLRLGLPDGSSSASLTLTPGQLREGVNLATTDLLRTLPTSQELIQAIGTKNYYQYTTWRRQELVLPREPELATAHRQLVGAMYGYMSGYEQIIRRLPKTFTARLIVEESMPQDRVPTTPFSGPQPAITPSTRPAVLPMSRPATRPTTRPA